MSYDLEALRVEAADIFIDSIKTANDNLLYSADRITNSLIQLDTLYVTHRQFSLMKSHCVELEKNILHLQNAMERFYELIEETEPYHQPLKAV